MQAFRIAHQTLGAAALLAVIASGAAPVVAQSRGLAGYSNCGVKLGTSVAQLKATEPNAVWERRFDQAAKRELPVAILGRDRDDRSAGEKRTMRIYFAGEGEGSAAYRISCRRTFVDDELARGLDELRAIVDRFGSPVETFNGERTVSFTLPKRGGVAFPLVYYWGGTRADLRAHPSKPMLLVEVAADGMDRDLFHFNFDLMDGRLRP